MSRTSRLVPLVAALVGLLIYHRYSLLTGLDRVQADTGDSRFIAFLLEHWNNALHGRAKWNSPPIFWPEQNTLAYSDLLVGMGVVHAALRSVLDVFPAMTLQLILLSLATFAATYALLARGLRFSVWGATVGAYFFSYSWPRFAQLLHVQLQFTATLPLMALLAVECLRDGTELPARAFFWRAAALAALLVLTLATAYYDGVFFVLAAVVALLLGAAAPGFRNHLGRVVRRQWRAMAGALALAALLLAPLVYVYLPVLRVSQGRPWAEIAGFLPTPGTLFWMGPENLAWGWFFERWPAATILARRPELRIGVGLIVSAAWIAAIFRAGLAVARPARLDRTRLDRTGATAALLVLTGLVLQLLMLRWPGDVSAWALVWRVFPGASAIRAVPRLELVVTLAMAVGLAGLTDALRHRWRLLLVAALGVAAIEQVGATQTYSGALAAALSRRVGDAIPANCRAAYVVAPPDILPPQPQPLDEAHFDAGAYLAANPDVAATWTDSPWQHYLRFGRAEGRLLDPYAMVIRTATMFFAYNYTIPLAAALRGIPVVNGLSGWEPPGWHLFDVLSPDAPAELGRWLQLKGVPPAAVCVVPIRVTLPEIADPPARLMP